MSHGLLQELNGNVRNRSTIKHGENVMATATKPPIILPLMTYEEFQEYEYKIQLQGYYERGGMIAHEELTSEPRDFWETEH